MKSSNIYLAGFLLFLSGCASSLNPLGEQYHEPVAPGITKPLNWTGKPTTEGAAEVYFGASSRREFMITFRDRLLAYRVDGVDLPGVKVGNGATGYQAIALSPGVHSISYCHTTKSDLATGVVMCDFEIKDYQFEANARYMVSESVVVQSVMGGERVSVRTRMDKIK
jgi:hypothetical protein